MNNTLRNISNSITKAINAGHNGIFSNADIALLLGVPNDNNFSKTLYRAVKAGVLKKYAALYFAPLSFYPMARVYLLMSQRSCTGISSSTYHLRRNYVTQA